MYNLELKQIRGWYRHRGQKIVLPQKPNYRNWKWEPEPQLVMITKDGVVPHPNPNEPNAHVFLAIEISPFLFRSYVRYYAAEKSKDYSIWEAGISRVATMIYLVAEPESSEIYCVAVWKEVTLLIGKLLRSDNIYKICIRAFGKFLR